MEFIQRGAHHQEKQFSKEAIFLPLTLQTHLGGLLQAYPELGEVLQSRQIHCSCCMGVGNETIEAAALLHHIEPLVLLAELSEVKSAIERSKGIKD